MPLKIEVPWCVSGMPRKHQHRAEEGGGGGGECLGCEITLVSQPFTWNSYAVPTCVRCPHIQLNICYFKGQILIWSTKHLPTKHNWFPQTHFHVQFSTFGRQCFLLFNISRHIKKKNPFFSIPTLHTHCDLPVTVVGQLAKSWYNRGKNTGGGSKSQRTFNPTNVTIKMPVMRTAHRVVISLAVLKKRNRVV